MQMESMNGKILLESPNTAISDNFVKTRDDILNFVKIIMDKTCLILTCLEIPAFESLQICSDRESGLKKRNN